MVIIFESSHFCMQDESWFDCRTSSPAPFDIDSHILYHTRNMSRRQAAPLILLQSTTNRIPRPVRKHDVNFSSRSTISMASTKVRINNHLFSMYECQIACAIQLYIRNANNKVPTDETLGFILKALRGEVNGEPLPCQRMVSVIEHYDTEAVRAIYLSV